MADEERMRCMEVWGGHGSENAHLTRPGLDIWVWSDAQSLPEAGGGDLHLLSSCASGRITRLLLADVCGFGSLFGGISDELRDIMKRNVNRVKQTRAVRDLNCRLENASRRGGFASTLISTYFAPTRSLTLCNAGHPPPMLYRAAEADWTLLKQSQSCESTGESALGVVSPTDYQEFSTKLQQHDLLLIYSNSLTECRLSSGVTVGSSGLFDLVKQIDPSRPERIGTTLVERLRGERDENLKSEDTTILLCKATDTPVAWKDNLLAPFRLLRNPTDNTTIG